MDDLEALRQKKIKNLQQQQQQDNNQHEQETANKISQIEQTMLPYLSREAKERYGTIKLAHPDLALQSLISVAQMLEKSTVQVVHDKMYKDLLMRIQPQRKNTKIIRK